MKELIDVFRLMANKVNERHQQIMLMPAEESYNKKYRDPND